MAENSNIEWTDHTFNPWIGCTKVSEGCKFCYALREDERRGRDSWGPKGARRMTSESYWKQPRKWNQEAEGLGVRYRVFCASQADVFDEWPGQLITNATGDFADCQLYILPDGRIHIPGYVQRLQRQDKRPLTLDDVRPMVYDMIEQTPHLDWLLLTKRIERVMGMVPVSWRDRFPKNVWLGTSVEDQETADERIPHLLKCPAAVRFLSCEPLLGVFDASHYLHGCPEPVGGGHRGYATKDMASDAECPEMEGMSLGVQEPDWEQTAPPIDWVITGGESGPKARPMKTDWARSLRDQCQAAGVPYFFKQFGEWVDEFHSAADPTTMVTDDRFCEFTEDGKDYVGLYMVKVGKKKAGRLLDGREWNEFPQTDIMAV